MRVKVVEVLINKGNNRSKKKLPVKVLEKTRCRPQIIGVRERGVRAWCQVNPMHHAKNLLDRMIDRIDQVNSREITVKDGCETG